MPDFISPCAPGFNNWQVILLAFITANRAALGVSTGDLAALTAAQTAWTAAYGTHQATQAQAVSDRQAKDDACAAYVTLTVWLSCVRPPLPSRYPPAEVRPRSKTWRPD